MCVIDVLKEKIWLKSIIAPLQVSLHPNSSSYFPVTRVVLPRVTFAPPQCTNTRPVMVPLQDMLPLALTFNRLCQTIQKFIPSSKNMTTGNSCKKLPSNPCRCCLQTHPTFVRRFRKALRNDVFFELFNSSKSSNKGTWLQPFTRSHYICSYTVLPYFLYSSSLTVFFQVYLSLKMCILEILLQYLKTLLPELIWFL